MRKRSDSCLNCGEPTPKEYCPACGQRNADYRVSLGELMLEALDGLFQLDSRFLRTVPAFLLRPWTLIRDYNAGKRASFTSPLRLYIFLSIAYFFALSATKLNPGLLTDNPERPGPQLAGSIKIGEDDKAPLPGSPDSIDSLQLHTGSRRLDAHLRGQLQALAKMDRKEALRRIGESFLSQAPKGLFLLMPVFALLLKLLFFSSRKFYIEHLVFSLFFHAYAFLLLLLSLPSFMSPLGGWLSLWATVALLLSLKRVYGDSYPWTVAKLALLAFGYFIVLAVGAVLLLLVSLVLL